MTNVNQSAAVDDNEVNDQKTAHLIAVWNSRSVTVNGLETVNKEQLSWYINAMIGNYQTRWPDEVSESQSGEKS